MPYLHPDLLWGLHSRGGNVGIVTRFTFQLHSVALEVAVALAQPSPLNPTDLWHIGGAVRRDEPNTSAFYGRNASSVLNAAANWDDPADDAANINWVRAMLDDMAPWSDGSRYLNFAGLHEGGSAMVRAAFGPQHARLMTLKAQYDPENLFRLNQNIAPEPHEDGVERLT